MVTAGHYKKHSQPSLQHGTQLQTRSTPKIENIATTQRLLSQQIALFTNSCFSPHAKFNVCHKEETKEGRHVLMYEEDVNTEHYAYAG